MIFFLVPFIKILFKNDDSKKLIKQTRFTKHALADRLQTITDFFLESNAKRTQSIFFPRTHPKHEVFSWRMRGANSFQNCLGVIISCPVLWWYCNVICITQSDYKNQESAIKVSYGTFEKEHVIRSQLLCDCVSKINKSYDSH